MSKGSHWQKGISSAKFSMRGKLPMAEGLCNPHFVKVGSMKNMMFLSFGHILIFA